MKELLQQKAEAYSIGKSWDRKTQSFIEAGYVDQTKKETFLAGAKEILDNPELYGLVKKEKYDGLSKEATDYTFKIAELKEEIEKLKDEVKRLVFPFNLIHY